MIDIECYINNLCGDFEAIVTHEVLPVEFDPIQTLLRIHDPYASSRKWFVYDDAEDEERYNEDW